MAVREKKTPIAKTGDERTHRFSRAKLRLLFFLAAGAIIAGCLIYAACTLPGKLFSRNQRFLLKEFKIDSTGYWQGREDELMQELGLRKNTNLFLIDVKILRNKLKKIQNVRDAQVRIVMPDTIIVKLDENIPRARMLGKNNRICIIDENGNELKQNNSGQNFNHLPLIVNLGSGIQNALNLVKTVNNSYQDIRIERISINRQDNLAVTLQFRRTKTYTAVFPNKECDYSGILNVLQTTILLRDIPEGKIIDVKYDGRVIFTDKIQ